MGKVLYMGLMTLRGYAKHRRSLGLSGGSPNAVSKALTGGRIARAPSGLIDADAADRNWKRNTVESEQVDRLQGRIERGPKVQTSAKTLELTEEFWRGAAWLSFQICATARRNWPDRKSVV